MWNIVISHSNEFGNMRSRCVTLSHKPVPKIIIVCKIFQSEKTLGCYFKFSSKAPLHQRQKPSLQHGYLSCIAACLLKTRHGRERGKTQILAFTMFSRNQIRLFSCRLSGSENSRTSNEDWNPAYLADRSFRPENTLVRRHLSTSTNVAKLDVSQPYASVRVEVVFE